MSDILEISGLTVTFGATTALDDVALTLHGGEVHGLLGHNGSGKSTLIKTLAGINQPSAGRITVSGEDLSLPVTATSSRRHGFAFVHQGLGLATDLTVLENIAVGGYLRTRTGRIRWREHARRARAELALFGSDLNLSAPVSSLAPVDQAIVAIARALTSVEGEPGTRTLVLDEPTVYLPRHEVQSLFDAVTTFTRAGDAVLFVSHRIDEVMAITDRVTVLRAGRVVASAPTSTLSEDDIVALIVGRELVRSAHGVSAAVNAPVCAAVHDVTSAALHEVSFEVRRGEIVGVTGLAGSGYADLPYVLAGATPATGRLTLPSGDVVLDGLRPDRALAAGVALVPADRPHLGVIGELSIIENVTMPWLARFFRRGAIKEHAETRWAVEVIDRFGVRYGSATDPIKTLSGGNQQKVVIAKWLANRPNLLVLHEPTQGVDIGGRFEIYDHLRAAAAAGTGVLAASESPEELAELCDRVLIIKDGRIDRVLTGVNVDKHAIVEATLMESRAA